MTSRTDNPEKRKERFKELGLEKEENMIAFTDTIGEAKEDCHLSKKCRMYIYFAEGIGFGVFSRQEWESFKTYVLATYGFYEKIKSRN